MANVNVCMLGGNLTRDVEVKSVGESKVAVFSIAYSESYKKKDGEQVKDVSFFDVEAWNAQAEQVAKFFKKGDPILFEASAKQESWDDKTSGQKRTKIKFRLIKFWFVGKRKDKEESGDGEAPLPTEDNNGETPF